ncbi:hypothetical protein C8Q80DRAFT_427179 [Daedaleopsis nitida]|nr:hypothetical protein C8Q80DRAFT_427179 [Daedaleopsis nitida]
MQPAYPFCRPDRGHAWSRARCLLRSSPSWPPSLFSHTEYCFHTIRRRRDLELVALNLCDTSAKHTRPDTQAARNPATQSPAAMIRHVLELHSRSVHLTSLASSPRLVDVLDLSLPRHYLLRSLSPHLRPSALRLRADPPLVAPSLRTPYCSRIAPASRYHNTCTLGLQVAAISVGSTRTVQCGKTSAHPFSLLPRNNCGGTYLPRWPVIEPSNRRRLFANILLCTLSFANRQEIQPRRVNNTSSVLSSSSSSSTSSSSSSTMILLTVRVR